MRRKELSLVRFKALMVSKCTRTSQVVSRTGGELKTSVLETCLVPVMRRNIDFALTWLIESMVV